MQGSCNAIAQYALQAIKLPVGLQFLTSLLPNALCVTLPSPPVTVVTIVRRTAPDMSNMVSKKLAASCHTSFMTVVAPERKRENSRTISRSPKKHRFNTVTEPPIAVMEEQDLLDVTEAAKLSHLLADSEAAQTVLRQAVKMVRCVYTKVLKIYTRRTCSRNA